MVSMVSTQEQMFVIHDFDAGVSVEQFVNTIPVRGPVDLAEEFGIAELVRMMRRRV
jgi:hypothetical protein